MYLGSLFLNEIFFFFHALPYGLPDSVKEAIYTSGRKVPLAITAWLRRGLNVTAVFLFAFGYYTTGGALLGASVLLWALLYGLIVQIGVVFKDTDESIIYNTWGLSHFGLINWFFDVPGNGCPSTKVSHVVIILLNVAGALAITLGLIVAPAIERAWSCYGDVDISQLTSGPCASYFNLCPGNDKRCPDFSVPACLLPSTDINCGADKLKEAVASEFEVFATVGFGLLSGSAALYAITFNAKYDSLNYSAVASQKMVGKEDIDYDY